MSKTTPDSRGGRPTILLWTLVVGLLAFVVILGPWDHSTRPWNYPELGPLPTQEVTKGDPASDGDRPLPEGIRLDEGVAPVRVELRLRPKGAILTEDEVYGPASIVVESIVKATVDGVAVDRSVPCTMRAIAGVPGEFVRSIEGRAVVSGLPRARVLLSFEGPGGRRFDTLVRAPRTEPILIDWSKTGVVAGKVFGPNGGSPDAGASVEIAGQSFECTADGSFSATGLVQGSSVPIVVRAPGRSLHLEMIEVGASPYELRFVLREGWKLRCTTPDVAPSVLAVVPAAPMERPFPFYALRPRYLGRGRFEVDGLPIGHDVSVATVTARQVCPGPTHVRAPFRSGTVDAVVASTAPETVQGFVNLAAQGPRAAIVTITASDAKGPPWGVSLFGGESLVPGAYARLGTATAHCVAGQSYVVAMPARRTELRVEATGFLGEARVLQRARRLRADFELEIAPTDPMVPAPHVGGDARLEIEFDDLPPVVPRLELQLFWSGEPRGSARRVDPRRVHVVPLGGPALIDLVYRRPGHDRPLASRTLRVLAHEVVRLPFPGT
ncbi:MAG: hypothetical protein H6834_01085 [Planctomycetes bacterium]|nr:hypothetical protein [Planctomycetota bacterium]